MRCKVFVCAKDGLDGVLHGWQRLVPKVTTGVNPFTGQPMMYRGNQPAAPIPDDALASFDEVPGTIVPWNARFVADLEKAFSREADASRAQHLLVGPLDSQRAFAVPDSVTAGLAELAPPFSEFAERVARCALDAGHANEHDEPMDVPIDDYFDLSLDELRKKTFRLEDLEPRGQRGRAFWQERFRLWERILAAAVPIAKTVARGQGCFYVQWPDPEEPATAAKPARKAAAKGKAKKAPVKAVKRTVRGKKR